MNFGFTQAGKKMSEARSFGKKSDEIISWKAALHVHKHTLQAGESIWKRSEEEGLHERERNSMACSGIWPASPLGSSCW